jgi:hypothetical protein
MKMDLKHRVKIFFYIGVQFIDFEMPPWLEVKSLQINGLN